jgi:hypothetical protein
MSSTAISFCLQDVVLMHRNNFTPEITRNIQHLHTLKSLIKNDVTLLIIHYVNLWSGKCSQLLSSSILWQVPHTMPQTYLITLYGTFLLNWKLQLCRNKSTGLPTWNLPKDNTVGSYKLAGLHIQMEVQ